jgi:PAS domain S-box-containing protein
MRDALDRAPCGFLSFTDDGTIREVNATLLELLRTSREELIGRPILSILSVGSRIFSQTHLLPMLRLHGRMEEIFLLLRDRDGREAGVLVNAVRRRSGDDFVNHCVVTAAGERQKYEEELLRARRAAESANRALEAEREQLRIANQALVRRTEELERQRLIADEANRAKSAFLAFMSHELRTPLTAIIGYGQLLEYAELAADDRDSVAQILSAGQHLLSLITDVLDLSAIEAGRLEVRPEPASVREAVLSTVDLVRLAAAERGIEVVTQDPETDDAWILADRRRLRQLLLNLLSNAIKYNRENGRVEVAWERQGGMLRIHVSDTGRGIAPNDLARLFTAYERLDEGRGPEVGSGLGLALCRRLAEAMGGEIGVESVVGVGSTFWVEMPHHAERPDRAPVELAVAAVG